MAPTDADGQCQASPCQRERRVRENNDNGKPPGCPPGNSRRETAGSKPTLTSAPSIGSLRRMPLLAIENLLKAYTGPDGSRHVVVDVPAFAMGHGDAVALAGP